MLNKCLEPLTTIGCALAGAAGLLGGGATAGVLIGGAALVARFREQCALHGLDSPALIHKMQLSVIRRWDRADQTQDDRDAIGAADAAMARHIADCLPTREELAATALKGAAVYPAEAARMVVDRLAARDADCALLFAEVAEGEPRNLSRHFALTVVEAALRTAKDDKDYAPLLTLDLVIEVAGGVGRIERGAEADRARDEAFQAQAAANDAEQLRLMRLVAAQLGGGGQQLEQIKAAIAAAFIDDPQVTDDDVVTNVLYLIRSRDEARIALAAIPTAPGNHDRSQQVAVEQALAAGDDDAALDAIAERAAALNERQEEYAVERSALESTRALLLLGRRDWQAADKAWALAEAMLIPFDRDAADHAIWQATEKLLEHGTIFASRGAIDTTILRATQVRDRLQPDDDAAAFGSWSNLLGIALQTQGDWTGGDAGLTLLAAAVTAHRAALTVRAEAVTPADWAMTQNNLGAALLTQGKRTGGAAGLSLLAEAVAAYRAALTVYTEAAMPADWAMTQNNLGAALSTQGERTVGRAGLTLLAEAVAAHRAALTVYTEAAMPADWAMTQNNLGASLSKQGERTGGAAGLTLLAEAVTAYRAALTVRTEAATPAQWAMTQNNLGTVLQMQGALTPGTAGLALMAEAMAACRAALTVYTETTMPAQWAMTMENLALAHEAMADLRDDPLPDLRAAEALLLDALTVYTPEHMSFYHDKATALLARIRRKIAAFGAE